MKKVMLATSTSTSKPTQQSMHTVLAGHCVHHIQHNTLSDLILSIPAAIVMQQKKSHARATTPNDAAQTAASHLILLKRLATSHKGQPTNSCYKHPHHLATQLNIQAATASWLHTRQIELVHTVAKMP